MEPAPHEPIRRIPLPARAAAAALLVAGALLAIRASRPDIATQVEHHVAWRRFEEAWGLLRRALAEDPSERLRTLYHETYAEEWSRTPPGERAAILPRLRADGLLEAGCLVEVGRARISLGELHGGDLLLAEAARRGAEGEDLPPADELDLAAREAPPPGGLRAGAPRGRLLPGPVRFRWEGAGGDLVLEVTDASGSPVRPAERVSAPPHEIAPLPAGRTFRWTIRDARAGASDPASFSIAAEEEAALLRRELGSIAGRHAEEHARRYHAGNLLTRRGFLEEARAEWRALAGIMGCLGAAREKERRLDLRLAAMP